MSAELWKANSLLLSVYFQEKSLKLVLEQGWTGSRTERKGGGHQISVDEAVGLQVLHPLADIQADTQQGPQAEAALPLPEEVEQTAVLHELGDDVDGLLMAAHSVQLHQFGVRQFPGQNTIYGVAKRGGSFYSMFRHYCLNILYFFK